MQFLKEVSKAMDSAEVRRRMRESAENEFQQRKKKLLSDFIGHPVTQEILSGPNSDNYIGTLTGRGNLFTFIGFSESSDPINPLYQYLNRSIRMLKNPHVIKQKYGATYTFKCYTPDERDLVKVAPMPWERGRSWATGISRGISGLSYYIYKATEGARSGGGVQTSTPYIAGLMFRRQPYLLGMFSKLKAGVKI